MTTTTKLLEGLASRAQVQQDKRRQSQSGALQAYHALAARAAREELLPSDTPAKVGEILTKANSDAAKFARAVEFHRQFLADVQTLAEGGDLNRQFREANALHERAAKAAAEARKLQHVASAASTAVSLKSMGIAEAEARLRGCNCGEAWARFEAVQAELNECSARHTKVCQARSHAVDAGGRLLVKLEEAESLDLSDKNLAATLKDLKAAEEAFAALTLELFKDGPSAPPPVE